MSPKLSLCSAHEIKLQHLKPIFVFVVLSTLEVYFHVWCNSWKWFYLEFFCCLQAIYKQEFEQTKAKNEFKPTDTESYKEMKQVANVCSDVSCFI